MTDEAQTHVRLGHNSAEHGYTNHSQDQYVSPIDPTIHTNRVEGFFSVFKRGMKGVYQHASKAHFHRYAAEFDFRYSNRIARGIDDQTRLATMVEGAWGRRLTYKAADSKRSESRT